MDIERFDRLMIKLALSLLIIAVVLITVSPFLYEQFRNSAPANTEVITIYFDGRDNWSRERMSAWNTGFGTSDLKEIRIEKGRKVVFRLMATDVHHGFTLPAFGIKPIEIKPGKMEEIEFTADKTGSFIFFCPIPCGPAHNHMTATLIVM